MEAKSILPENKVFEQLEKTYKKIIPVIDKIEDNDSSHGLFLSAAFDRVEAKEGGGEKMHAKVNCRIWGNPLNVEQLMYAIANENPAFGDVVLKTAKRIARNKLEKLGVKKSGIIAPPTKKLFIPNK